MFLLKIYKIEYLPHNSTWRIAYPNLFLKSLRDSFSFIFMFWSPLIFYFYQAEHK